MCTHTSQGSTATRGGPLSGAMDHPNSCPSTRITEPITTHSFPHGCWRAELRSSRTSMCKQQSFYPRHLLLSPELKYKFWMFLKTHKIAFILKKPRVKTNKSNITVAGKLYPKDMHKEKAKKAQWTLIDFSEDCRSEVCAAVTPAPSRGSRRVRSPRKSSDTQGGDSAWPHEDLTEKRK